MKKYEVNIYYTVDGEEHKETIADKTSYLDFLYRYDESKKGQPFHIKRIDIYGSDDNCYCIHSQLPAILFDVFWDAIEYLSVDGEATRPTNYDMFDHGHAEYVIRQVNSGNSCIKDYVEEGCELDESVYRVLEDALINRLCDSPGVTTLLDRYGTDKYKYIISIRSGFNVFRSGLIEKLRPVYDKLKQEIIDNKGEEKMLTDSEREQVIKMHKEGIGLTTIAEELNICRASARLVVDRYKLNTLMETVARNEELIGEQHRTILGLEKEIRSLKRKQTD